MIGKVTIATIDRPLSERLSDAAAAVRELARAEEKVERASEVRRALPPGSSRARVTTANARWSTACEARDRVRAQAIELVSLAGLR